LGGKGNIPISDIIDKNWWSLKNSKPSPLLMAEILNYLRLVVYPFIIYRVLYTPGGAGFLPLTVLPKINRPIEKSRKLHLHPLASNSTLGLA